jgi:hypothetical protein
VDNQPEQRETRRDKIGERLAEIRTRIDDLQQAQQENRHPVASTEQLVEAQHRAASSGTTARQAHANTAEAFLHAAEAHDSAAIQHERTAADRNGNQEHHRQEAARHRAAADEDRQRAEAVLCRMRAETSSASGCGAGQATFAGGL